MAFDQLEHYGLTGVTLEAIGSFKGKDESSPVKLIELETEEPYPV